MGSVGSSGGDTSRSAFGEATAALDANDPGLGMQLAGHGSASKRISLDEVNDRCAQAICGLSDAGPDVAMHLLRQGVAEALVLLARGGSTRARRDSLKAMKNLCSFDDPSGPSDSYGGNAGGSIDSQGDRMACGAMASNTVRRSALSALLHQDCVPLLVRAVHAAALQPGEARSQPILPAVRGAGGAIETPHGATFMGMQLSNRSEVMASLMG